MDALDQALAMFPETDNNNLDDNDDDDDDDFPPEEPESPGNHSSRTNTSQ
jgi:hypothetical protein